MDVPQGARLLSIGEIFDRAISIVLGNFLSLTLSFGAFLLPYTLLLSWVEHALAGKVSGAISSAISHPDRPTSLNLLDPAYRLDANGVWLIALGIIVFPLAGAMLAVSTAAIVNGDRPSFSSSSRRAFRRWPQALGVSLLSMGSVAGSVFGVAAAYLITLVIWDMATNQSTFSDSAAMVYVIVLSIVTVVFAIGAIPWAACAFGATVLDDVGVFRALRNAWRACFRRSVAVRSLLFGFGTWAILFVFVLFSYILAAIGIAIHQNYAAFAVRLVALTEIAVFVNAAGAVFYLDAKAREERRYR
jgi:hypothetical protein